VLPCAPPMCPRHLPTALPGDRGARSVLVVVFTTILIDFVGFSVLIPVLPLYAERLGATPFQVGLILTVYALAQLLFLPAWGWVSDRVGRRPVILISLLGTALSFLILAAADSIGTIYLARTLAGFFAASIGTAQAVVTDVTAPSDRARGMGLIGAAFGFGMILGPLLGGGLAAVSEKLPFYAIAALAALNLVAAWWRLPESRPGELASPDWSDFGRSLIPTPVRLVAATHGRRVALYLYLFFHLFTAFAMLEAMITLYLGLRFGADEIQAAAIFAWIGAVLVFTQGVLLRNLVNRFGESRLVAVGMVAMGAGLCGVAAAPSFEWFFAIGALIAFGNGIAFPSFTSLYSKACAAEQAGELLGQGNAMVTAGRIVGSTVAGFAMQGWTLGAPFLIAGAMMFVALALFVATRRILLLD
jgi:DHA1 family tetracycline resistance protein-like MFS transporter